MKTTLFLSITALLAGSLLAADSSPRPLFSPREVTTGVSLLDGQTIVFGELTVPCGPRDDIAAAAKKLGEQASYSWRTTTVVPEGSRLRIGPTEGKTEKDGFTFLSVTINDNTTQAVLKGDRGAVSGDGGWQSLAELESAEGPARFRAMATRNFKAPATHVAELAAGVKELARDGDALSGDLKEDVAATMLTFRRGAAGGDGPTVSNAKGSVKFWLKDGALVKYEIKVSGKVNFNGNDRDVERTMTTEIKDVGSTKVEVPEEAKSKLS